MYLGTCNNRRKLERESEYIIGEHISRVVFTECLHHKRDEYHGYKFVFISENMEINNPVYICSGKENSSKGKKIIQYDLDMNKLNVWNNTNEIADYLNITLNKTSSVLSCCKQNQKTAFGYIWKYQE